MDRKLKRKLQRDVLLEELIRSYVGVINTTKAYRETEHPDETTLEKLEDMQRVLTAKIIYKLSDNGVLVGPQFEHSSKYCIYHLCDYHCGTKLKEHGEEGTKGKI